MEGYIVLMFRQETFLASTDHINVVFPHATSAFSWFSEKTDRNLGYFFLFSVAKKNFTVD